MTQHPAPARAAAPDAVERALLLRVLSTLLREDVCGLRTRSTAQDAPDGRWLRLAGPAGEHLLVPVRPDGFQCEYAARLPLVRVEPSARGGAGQRELAAGADVLSALAGFAAAEDAAGFAAFAAEYRAALAALRLQDATREETAAGLAARFGPDTAAWRGHRAALAFDTLAARRGHPLYPTSAARTGWSDADIRAYAPEFAPSFELGWLAVPVDDLTLGAGAPQGGFWPLPSDLGLRGLDGSHLALPVHPLTAAGPLREALALTGLAGRAVLADRTYLTAAPTLSTRTVALPQHPRTHLKLSLATSTLGLLNRRTIKPGTLVDGAAAQRLIAEVTAREPRFQGRVLHCDETRWVHAGHELLAVLARELPAGLADCTALPLAALPATAPGGRLVADQLADRYTGGDLAALFDAVLTPLLDWQAALFGYGIALESHQQNITLLLDDQAGSLRVRLLFKDDDGLRVNRRRLSAALGQDADRTAAFDDPRITVDGDGPLLDLFTTVTVHLCAGALAHALSSGPGRPPLAHLLGIVRDRLAAAAARIGDLPGEPGRALRTAVLEAERLPVKAMVTAGTLLSKQRSGAADINKFYTSGPNYLLQERR
ncbi:IucA/IucC family protein [Actinacidiphila bryophytorum]|uniref:IucA/IucC family protein n=1 Tax=Actinacidiphila bryophytorum TaxID=1436133 RepID=UPI002176B489|nr:IucA/IucC family protein [Actinacidiphila bryophytorum]UWE11233.1 IucA/IucC family siderophore biosynthesis protein [Actinacidiphila bryophytorum]